METKEINTQKMDAANDQRPLLDVCDLSVHYHTRDGIVHAVDHVYFEVNEAEIVGLVGESGSGKSTVGLGLVQLLPKPAGVIAGGEVWLNGKDLLRQNENAMQKVRGCEISMTFQDPMTYLNPVIRVGDQITEGVLLHQDISKSEAKQIAIEWISNVRITEPKRVYAAYPHELSGGMRQRILIAMALACEPDCIIADEPTTALDVTIQREIMDLLLSIRDRFNTSILVITHDLGVVSELCDSIYVMYAGSIMEYGEIYNLVKNPQHPYTQALLRSAVSIDEFHETLYAVGGFVPSLVNLPVGCRFRPRCPEAMDICNENPPAFLLESGGWARCWLHENREVLSC
jgi:oligopeptide/dipeptide ABC transporter ATP-binding protein